MKLSEGQSTTESCITWGLYYYIKPQIIIYYEIDINHYFKVTPIGL